MSGVSQGEFEAIERAGSLFDETVQRYLSGVDVDVVIDWVEVPSTESEGEVEEVPRVLIDGRTAEEFYEVIVTEEMRTFNDVERAIGASKFNDMMGAMWEDTLDFYEELDELDLALDGLAMSREAGYFEKAKVSLEKDGIIGPIGDGEMMSIARSIARDELGEWAEAVERYETAKKSADECFSKLPDVNWLLVGDVSGAVRYVRTKRSTYSQEIHAVLEETYREKLHMFSAPLETSPGLSTPTPTAFQLDMDVVPPHDKPTI